MNPIRREVLNGLLVLIISTLLSAAIAAFQIRFNVEVWVLIVMAIAIAVGGYVVFEFVLSAERRETEERRKTEDREMEWLRRVGNSARLELDYGPGGAATALTLEAIRAMRGGNYTVLSHIDRGGGDPGGSGVQLETRTLLFGSVLEQLKRGNVREYKRIICFDSDVLAADPELRSGVLKVGEGPGTILRPFAEHCRVMMETQGCSLYIAPVVLRSAVLVFFGTDKASMTVDTVDQDTGTRAMAGVMFFYDPPNGDIIERFWQVERATERRMVAVHKIRFPDEAETLSKVATQ